MPSSRRSPLGQKTAGGSNPLAKGLQVPKATSPSVVPRIRGERQRRRTGMGRAPPSDRSEGQEQLQSLAQMDVRDRAAILRGRLGGSEQLDETVKLPRSASCLN